MSPTAILVFACLINLSWCAPAMDSMDSVTMTSESVFSESKLTEPQTPQPNVTISLNCTCIIQTSKSMPSRVVFPGLIANGKSDYRCGYEKTFNDCKNNCVSKKNEPIFNIESSSIGVNITNGVNVNDYLCGLMEKGDSATVYVTTQIECTESSTDFELFNSRSNSISLSPPLNCPANNDSNDVTTLAPSIGQPTAIS